MSDKEGISKIEKMISERNQKVVNFISGLDLGIHIIGFPENPRFVSPDWKYLLNGYVKNFKITLHSKTKDYGDGEVILECRVDADHEKLREIFVEWMNFYEHKRIYTLVYNNSELYITGKGYHDKINDSNPYPVFARFSPQPFTNEKAKKIQDRFPEYNLKINEQNGIYTLICPTPKIFVVGYNHHDKDKLEPYPVFAKYFPNFYYELEKAEELQARYKEYDLEIK